MNWKKTSLTNNGCRWMVMQMMLNWVKNVAPHFGHEDVTRPPKSSIITLCVRVPHHFWPEAIADNRVFIILGSDGNYQHHYHSPLEGRLADISNEQYPDFLYNFSTLPRQPYQQYCDDSGHPSILCPNPYCTLPDVLPEPGFLPRRWERFSFDCFSNVRFRCL